MIIRVGDGQTKYGKILDPETHYYNYIKGKYDSEKEHVIQDVIERGYQYHIYVSKGNKAYQQISFDELKNL